MNYETLLILYVAGAMALAGSWLVLAKLLFRHLAEDHADTFDALDRPTLKDGGLGPLQSIAFLKFLLASPPDAMADPRVSRIVLAMRALMLTIPVFLIGGLAVLLTQL